MNRISILLVDDQPAKLLTYEAILADLGEHLIKAHSAREALEQLLANDVAVILVDVCMPELDGFELVQMIREHPRYEHTAIIFVSAIMLTDFDRLRGYRSGAVDYVSVPVVPEILRAKVAVFVDLYRKTKQLEALNRELEARVAERTEALREADRRKDEFLATLGHELRNPLAPIRNALQLLSLDQLTPTRRDEVRRMIQRQVEHMVRLVDDLLDVSRISEGKIALRLDTVELNDVVRRALEISQPLVEARGIAVSVESRERTLCVQGDLTRLVQVLGNVLHNAAKYTERSGAVQIVIERHNDDAVISVADTGIGIPAEMLSRIFDLFTQVRGNDNGAMGGLGIGLALARRLVEMHDGTLTASSAGIGRGSTFVLRLPALELGSAATMLAPSSVAPAAKLRIIVADDNQDAADSLTLLLEAAGHEATTVYDGQAAIDAAVELCPDVVVLDIGMPALDGCEAARRIRAEPWGGNVFLVALTGWGQPADQRRAEAAGFDLHLTKPVDPVKMVAMLAEHRCSAR